MIVTAKLRNLHIAPRKVRLVADLIRGKSAKDARAVLDFITKKPANPVLKLLNSAIANAKNNFQMDPANLYISKITVDEGPKIKRWRARARGSAYVIQKKISHINLTLDEITKPRKYKNIKKAGQLTPGVDRETPGVEMTHVRKQERPKPKQVAEEAKKPVVSRVAKKIFRRKVF